MEALNHVAAQKRTIKVLVAHIRAMNARIKEVNRIHNESESELVHCISVRNRRIKKLEKQVENYREEKQLKHLQEVVKNQSTKIGEYVRIINDYEMEKL